MTEDEMVGWHHRLNGHGFGWTHGVGDGQGRPGVLWFMGSQRIGRNLATEEQEYSWSQESFNFPNASVQFSSVA